MRLKKEEKKRKMRRPYFPVGFPHKVCFSFSTLGNMKKGLRKTYLFSFFSHPFKMHATFRSYPFLRWMLLFNSWCFLFHIFFSATKISSIFLKSEKKAKEIPPTTGELPSILSHLFFIKLFKWVFEICCLPVFRCKVHRIFLIGCHPSLFQTKKKTFFRNNKN